jgi:hypothetical protein
VEETEQTMAVGGVVRVLWRNKVWWALPLAVLLILLGIVYALVHLSSADSEMYPTSKVIDPIYSRMC